MCVGGSAPFREEPQYQQPILERLSILDPSLHPILSFPEDVCVGLRLQQALGTPPPSQCERRQERVKKLSLKHKLASSRERSKFTSSLLRMGLCKSRPDRPRSSEGGGASSASARLERLTSLSPTSGVYDRNYGRKRAREPSLDRSDAQAGSPRLFLDSSSSCPTLVNLLPSSSSSPSSSLHGVLTRQLSTSSESSAPLGAGSASLGPGSAPSILGGPNTPQPIKRRRGESSFDINNIVIPMSVAATTRVEKLQYKEILTPRWRSVDIFSQPITEEEDEREVEDLSDCAFLQLHQLYEDQERSRWSWMALTPAKRRGSRSYKSLDGRLTPQQCGTNPPTPQPASPDLLLDYSSMVASPLSPPSPDSASNPPDSASNPPDSASNPQTPCSHRDSHRLLSSEDTRCSTPEYTYEEQAVSPWERRSFPLCGDPVLEADFWSCDVPQRIRSVSGSSRAPPPLAPPPLAPPPQGAHGLEGEGPETEGGGASHKNPAHIASSSSSSTTAPR